MSAILHEPTTDKLKTGTIRIGSQIHVAMIKLLFPSLYRSNGYQEKGSNYIISFAISAHHRGPMESTYANELQCRYD